MNSNFEMPFAVRQSDKPVLAVSFFGLFYIISISFEIWLIQNTLLNSSVKFKQKNLQWMTMKHCSLWSWLSTLYE